MVASYSDARNAIFAQLFDKINSSIAIIGYLPQIVWQGIETTEKMPVDKFWLRVSIQTALEDQKTLRADSDNTQKRRYTSNGLLFVEVFIPLDNPENYRKGIDLATFIKECYRGKQTANGVLFRKVTSQEIGKMDAWNQIKIVSEYQYDEVK